MVQSEGSELVVGGLHPSNLMDVVYILDYMREAGMIYFSPVDTSSHDWVNKSHLDTKLTLPFWLNLGKHFR